MSGYSATKAAQVGVRRVAAFGARRYRHPRQRRVSRVDDDRVPRGDGTRLRLLGVGARPQAIGRSTSPTAIVQCIRAAAGRGLSAPDVARIGGPQRRRAGFADRLVRQVRPAPRDRIGGGRSHAPALSPTLSDEHRHRDGYRAAVRRAGGRALVVGGWVRDRLLGQPSQGRRPRGLRPAGARLKALLDALRTRSTPSARASPSTRCRRRRFAAAARVEDRPRPPRLRGHRRSAHDAGRSGAATRLHRQRDRVGSAEGDLSRSVRRPRETCSSGVSCVPSTRATFADDSLRVLRGVQFAARFALEMEPETKALCRDIPLDDLPAERIWGEIEKLLLLARAAVGRLRARARARRRRAAVPGSAKRWSVVRRNRSGIPRATSGSTR